MTAQLSLPGLETPVIPTEADRLAACFARAAFFDIETAGLATGSPVTLIVGLRAGDLHTFVRGENLDDFLPWVEEVELLVSFNGATFDVPRVLDHFRVPRLRCPHLDLRTLTRGAGLRGGLKKIEQELGIERPADLQGMTGEDAEWLWRAWEKDGDRAARDRLIRYCQADVVGLRELAARLLERLGRPVEGALPAPVSVPPAAIREAVCTPPGPEDALYHRLRERARRQRPSGEL